MAGTFLPYLVALAWVSLFMLVGVALRARVRALQRLLLPSGLIGGVLGFAAINLGLVVCPDMQGWTSIEPSVFGVLTFHLYALSFVGIGLLRGAAPDAAGEQRRRFLRGSVWIAVMFTLVYAVQAIIGYGVFSGWRLLGGDADPILGYLFGTGFTQGPGQAMAYAVIWEGEPYGVANAAGVGLTFASVGFFAAAVIGVPLARWGLRRGWGAVADSRELPESFVTGVYPPDSRPSCADSVTHPANVDTMAYHLAVIFVVYGLAYCFGVWFARSTPQVIAPLGIGLIFFWGMLIAKILRTLGARAKLDRCLDDATVRRYIGLFVDFMVASVFMSIEVRAIQGVLVPIVVTIVIGSAATLAVIMWFGRRSRELPLERTLVTFGTCTGTVSTGLLLLRLADPKFETPVAGEVGMMNIFSTLITSPIIYFGLPFAPVPDFPMFWICVAMLVLCPLMLRLSGMVDRPKF